MNGRQARCAAATASAALIVFAIAVAFPSTQSSTGKAARCAVRHACTEAEVLQWMTDLSNAGRWGPDDQLGTANFITPDKRKEAAKLVRKGVSVSMAREVVENLPPAPGAYLIRSVTTLTDVNAVDMYTYSDSYHGSTFSHLDALCHFFYKGKMYNNFPVASAIVPGKGPGSGCVKNSIIGLKDGILTRGVLFDATLLPGKPTPEGWLKPGTPVYADELEMLEKIEHVKVTPGDAIFLYTGRSKLMAQTSPLPPGSSGWYVDTALFLKERSVSFMGSDAPNDVIPSGITGFPGGVPLHLVTLGALGVDLFDNLDLEQLAKTAKDLGRYDFMFTAAPLRIRTGMGSMLNPIATF